MVEQTNTGECHRHSVFIAHIDHIVVTDRSTRLCDILYAALVGTFDIVTEREEGVRAEGHILHLVEPCAFFLFCEYRRFFGEYFLPLTVCARGPGDGSRRLREHPYTRPRYKRQWRCRGPHV